MVAQVRKNLPYARQASLGVAEIKAGRRSGGGSRVVEKSRREVERGRLSGRGRGVVGSVQVVDSHGVGLAGLPK